MKLLRNSDFHWDFLSVEFFKGLYLVHSDETLRNFDLSSIFSERGIFQRSTLDSNSMKILRNSDFHRDFLSVEFFRGLYSVLSDETVEKFDLSSIFFLSVEFFRGPHLVHFWWNPLRVWTFIDIFQVGEFFQRSTFSTFSMNPLKSLVPHRYFLSVKFIRGLYLVHFDETLEKFDLSSIFSKSGIFQRSRLISNSMKLLRCSNFHRCFLNVDFFRGSHLVYFDETLDMFRLSSIFSECGIF